jgi:hypothetical protein
MKITPKSLRKELAKLLKTLDVPYRSIEVRRNPGIDMIIGLNWDEEGNMLLQYRDLIKDYSLGEIRSVLKHEVCHYLSLPASRMVSKTGKITNEVKYALVYREYLAHREFKERFGDEEGLRSYHVKHFPMYDQMVEGARKILSLKKFGEYPVVVNVAFAFMYDAMYFYVMDGGEFRDWCRKNNLKSLDLFLTWVREDMEYFYMLDLAQEDKENLVQDAVVFPLSLDFGSMFMDDRIVVHKSIADDRWKGKGELEERWKMRVIARGSIV